MGQKSGDLGTVAFGLQLVCAGSAVSALGVFLPLGLLVSFTGTPARTHDIESRSPKAIGESAHDPGARCAGSSTSGRTDLGQQRADLTGFGSVPGLSSGVASYGVAAQALRLQGGQWPDSESR
jgi:hypothetical protein